MSSKWSDRTTGRIDVERKVAESLGKPVEEVAEVMRAMLNTVAEELVSGRRVEFRRFGRWDVVERAPRRARNPRTNESVEVPARRVVTWTPGRQLADMVPQGARHE